MSWTPIEQQSDLESIRTASAQRPQLIFKHSTRCGISASARLRMEKSLGELAEVYDLHFLDLLNYRDLSNQIAEDFEVRHQSPQVLIVHRGDTVFDTSHGMIQPDDLLERGRAL